MKKYLLTFEFRYTAMSETEYDSQYKTKTVTIGVFDTLDESIKVGNENLKELSKKLTVKDGESFKKVHLFGNPRTLVSNIFTKDKVNFYGKIDTLDYEDLAATVSEALEARKQYDEFKQSEQDF